MSNKLSKIEIEVLDVLYKREYDGDLDFKIDDTIFSLKGDASSSNEIGYYLEKLKRNNYVDYKEASLSKGGIIHNKYRNNIFFIWWDDIYITYEGMKFIGEYRLTSLDKTKRSIKKFIYDVIIEIRTKMISHIATFILGIIVSYIYYLIFIK